MGSSEPLRFAQLKLELKLCPRLGPEVAALKFQPLHGLLPVGALGTDSPFSLHFFPANRRSTGQESGQEGIDNRQSERDEVRSQKPRRVQHERHQDHLGEQLGYTTGTLAPSAGNTPPAKRRAYRPIEPPQCFDTIPRGDCRENRYCRPSEGLPAKFCTVRRTIAFAVGGIDAEPSLTRRDQRSQSTSWRCPAACWRFERVAHSRYPTGGAAGYRERRARA